MKFAVNIFLFIFIVISVKVFGAEVTQVKGTKALINLSDLSAEVGQQFYILSSQGKKIAIIEIKQVKSGKAIAEILKGRAEIGGTLQVRSGVSSGPTSKDSSSEESSEIRSSSHRKLSGGVLLGMSMNTFSMNAGPNNSTSRDSASMSGNSFLNVKGFADYSLNPQFTIRGATGIETFTAQGSIAHTYCDNGTTANCSVNFTYLGLEGSAHFNYLTGKTKAWIGLGYSFLVQVAGSNNIPNLTTSSTNQMILASTGVDFGIGNGKFIPIVAEYGYFPGSTDVKASSIFLRAGYGMSF